MNLRKVILCVTVISTAICIMVLIATYIFPFHLMFKLMGHLPDASAIGIIGAADGPTSIYVSKTSNSYWIVVPFMVAIMGGIYLMISRKNRKNSGNKDEIK